MNSKNSLINAGICRILCPNVVNPGIFSNGTGARTSGSTRSALRFKDTFDQGHRLAAQEPIFGDFRTDLRAGRNVQKGEGMDTTSSIKLRIK